MSLNKFIFFVSLIAMVQASAQDTPGTTPPVPTPADQQQAPAGDHTTPPTGAEALPHTDSPDLVIKGNTFTYDPAEGRDPFKIFREIPIMVPGANGAYDVKRPESNLPLEKNIRTAMVPSEVVLQGILYKKTDPIALISVKGLKGINQLKVNSPIGRNEGKVIEIQKDHVVIEQVKDFDGQKFTEKITLKVREKKK